jgi:hypothetical protein
MLRLRSESELSYIGALAKLAPGQSVQTDSDSVQISTDSIGLLAILHRNGAEYMGRVKTSWFGSSTARTSCVVLLQEMVNPLYSPHP